MNWIKGNDAMVVNKAQEASVLNDLKVYIFIFAGFILFLAILVFVAVICRKFAEKVSKVFGNMKSRVFYNDIIETLDITYLQVTMTVGTQFSIWLQ